MSRVAGAALGGQLFVTGSRSPENCHTPVHEFGSVVVVVVGTKTGRVVLVVVVGDTAGRRVVGVVGRTIGGEVVVLVGATTGGAGHTLSGPRRRHCRTSLSRHRAALARRNVPHASVIREAQDARHVAFVATNRASAEALAIVVARRVM